jgi:hypothetical protein
MQLSPILMNALYETTNMHEHDKSMRVFYLPSYSFWLVFPVTALKGFTQLSYPLYMQHLIPDSIPNPSPPITTLIFHLSFSFHVRVLLFPYPLNAYVV